MSTAAAIANALSSQQPTTTTKSASLNGKRKRPGQPDSVIATSETATSREESLENVLPELAEILKSAYPFAQSILTRQIQSNHPSTKRTKRSTGSTSDTTEVSIQSQVDSKAYETLEEIAEDFDKAIDGIVEEQERSEGSKDAKSTDLPTIQQARSLQKEIHGVLGTTSTGKLQGSASSMSGNGSHGSVIVSPEGQSVLTLFGSGGAGQQPKQYFASPRNISSAAEDIGIDPMSTAMLPNGIFTTSILPPKTATLPKPKTGRTLKDILPPPPQSLPYKPPTAPPSRATRSQVVEWYKPSNEPPKTRPGAKDIYAEQTLTHGHWISYLSHTDTDESLSEKRLKRDRALSSEGPDESELEFLQQQRNTRARAKKSSLFRSAFSSFGPSRDDSNAIVPAEIRGQIWWEKAGKDIYRSFAEASAVDAEVKVEADDDSQNIDPALLEEQSRQFQEAIDAYEEPSVDEAMIKREKDEEEMLEDITDSIEALLMYQQDRHKATTASGRQGASQQPSEAEQQIYETMKAQLMLIVSQLPPHAVARLNGEKLGRLSVSTSVPISVPTYSGMLEELERPMMPASTHSQSQSRPANAVQQGSASRLMYQQQAAGTPPTRPNPQPPRSAAATTAQYGNRTQPPAQYGYQSQTVQQPQRSFQYSQQQAQSSQVPNGYRQQTANGYQQYAQYAGQANGSPAARPPHANQYTNRPQQGYQPRSGTYQAPTAPIASAAAGRSASPQNASNYANHGAAPTRPAYGAGQGQVQQAAGQNGQYAGGYARPSSGHNASAAQSAFTVGSIKFSDEELAQIEQRRQLQNSPPSLPQTPLGRPPSSNGIPMQAPTNGV